MEWTLVHGVWGARSRTESHMLHITKHFEAAAVHNTMLVLAGHHSAANKMHRAPRCRLPAAQCCVFVVKC